MPRRKPAPYELMERLESAELLDPPAETVSKVVRDLIPAGPVKDALSGTWLGHALHPLLMAVPLGTWLSAVLLDWIGGPESEKAADRLVSAGLVAYVPTVVTGWSDYADTTVGSAEARRVGIVHAVSNIAGGVLFAASRAARARGDRGRGRALALGGTGALTVGGYLGGHLSSAWNNALRGSKCLFGLTKPAIRNGAGPLIPRVIFASCGREKGRE